MFEMSEADGWGGHVGISLEACISTACSVPAMRAWIATKGCACRVEIRLCQTACVCQIA